MSTATRLWRLTVAHLRHSYTDRVRPIRAVVALAFVLRIAAMPLTALRINPYSTHDSMKFTAFAARIGTSLFTGPLFVPVDTARIYQWWGLLLAPFWAVPGPHWVYAHVGMALVGALAVWNVATIGRRWHSPTAGVLAALPVAVYPSFVLVHATLLREVAVLAGITTAARVLIVPPDRLTPLGRLVLALGVLTVTTLLRIENFPLYAVVLVVGGTVHYRWYRTLPRRVRIAAAGGLAVAFAVGLALAPRVVDYLARLRRYRTRGQSVYLPHIIPETVPAAIAFAPVGALYFLFTPFPWMVERVSEFVVFIEAVGNLAFAVAAIPGTWYALRRRLPGAIALGVGFVLGSLLYGLAEGNVGTAVRHRQMFVWVLYLFGAVGIVDWLRSRGMLRSMTSSLSNP